MAEDDERIYERIITPRPDPTKLSTEQVVREVAALRSLIEARLDAMDFDRGLLRKGLEKVPSDIASFVKEERNFHFEHVKALATQLELHIKSNEASERCLRETLETQMQLHVKANDTTERHSKDAIEKAFAASEKAVQAAFASAEKQVSEQNRSSAAATEKSERTIFRQLEGLETLIAASVKTLNDKIEAIAPPLRENIDDLKSRLTTIEGSGKGSRDLMAIIFTIAGICIAAIAAFIAFSKAG